MSFLRRLRQKVYLSIMGRPRDLFYRSKRYVEQICSEASKNLTSTPTTLITRISAEVDGKSLLQAEFSGTLHTLVEIDERGNLGYDLPRLKMIAEGVDSKTEITYADWNFLKSLFTKADTYLMWDSEGLVWMPEDAGDEYREKGNYSEAGQAYLRAAVSCEGGQYTFKQALDCFAKTGDPRQLLDAYLKACEKLGTSFLYSSDVERLEKQNLFDEFCQRLQDMKLEDEHAFSRIASMAKDVGKKRLAGDLYAVSGRNRENQYDFVRAIECYREAGTEKSMIRELYEQIYHVSDHSILPSGMMEWLWDNGELPAFVRNVMHDHPGHLWNELDDFLREHSEDSKTPEAYESCAELLVEVHEFAERENVSLVWMDAHVRECTYRTVAAYYERIGEYERAAQYYEQQLKYSDHGYSDKAAECYLKAGLPLKAGPFYEGKEKHEEAAAAYETGGAFAEAARCYRKAAEQHDKKYDQAKIRWLLEKATALEGKNAPKGALTCSKCKRQTQPGDEFCRRCGKCLRE